MRTIGPWAIRVVWLVLPLAAGPAFADALSDASRPVQLTASVGLWLGWAAILGVTLVPRTVSLTALRMAAPAALVAAVVAAFAGATGADDAAALSVAILAVAATWWAVTGDAFVDGSSYGDEQRFLLRAPLSLLVGGALIAWLLAVAAPVAGVIALAARAWVPGVVLVALGGVGVRFGVPALHRLSRRWLVLVPAGVVVHDHVALPDPLLFRRATVRRIGPAAVGDDGRADAVDVTLGAGGLVVEIALLEINEIPISVGRGRTRTVATVEATTVLVTPARPGAFLAAAGARLPVG